MNKKTVGKLTRAVLLSANGAIQRVALYARVSTNKNAR
jgi:hypothetical protein